MKIALITPLKGDWTYDSYTIIDGLIQLQKDDKNLEFYISNWVHPKFPLSVEEYVILRNEFIDFARKADLILLFECKGNADFKLAEEISRWERTAYIDGSELGNNKRYDFRIQRDVLLGRYSEGFGGIDEKMFKSCVLYFRREKPYHDGIIPLPYGITSVYKKHYDAAKNKDIDFFCVWGQDEYPTMRRYATELLIDFCEKQGFTCWVDRTETRDEFHEKLSRSKVGISVGGGGYDTARFWEILGNNCLLMTENIDIFHPDSGELNFKRIYQFNNLYDFKYRLEKVGKFLRKEYAKADLLPEYRDILSKHSSKTRALKIIKEAEAKFTEDEANNKLCGILVTSYDGNDDLWEPFFTLFFRYWPNCPYPVYLMTNQKEYRHERVTTIKVGGSKIWADNTKIALSRIPIPYILLFIDDIFMKQTVNTNYIRQLVDLMVKEKVASIHLAPFEAPKEAYPNDLGLGKISKTAGYRTSLRPAIWDKEIFSSLLKERESAWEMETEGTIRSRAIEPLFLGVRERAIPFYDCEAGVRAGKWFYDTPRIFKKEGIKIDLKKRPIDYDSKLRSILDSMRKNLFAQQVKQIPIVGKMLSWFFWRLSLLRVNKVFNSLSKHK